MVRLKESNKFGTISLYYEFQFHDGSIKGFTTLKSAGNYATFQFHDGSIKGHLRARHARLYCISIPRWFD